MVAERTGRRFRPSWSLSLLLACMVLAFLALGRWQLDRAEQKAEIQLQFEQAPRLQRLPESDQARRFSQVELIGRFDPDRHFFVDNQVSKGLPGVHVLTPFQLEDSRWILVNRGWLPIAPDRKTLPSAPTDDAIQRISGKLDVLYQPGKRLGEPDNLARDDWPQLLTYPDLDDIHLALGIPVYPLTLLLDEEHPAGFDGRQWRPVNVGATKHRARALLWFTFAAAAIVIWIILGFRRGKTG